MQTGIPCSFYRGGTSKGPVFLAEDLPSDRAKLDRVLLAAMGSPHPRQIDGLGGAESLTSKVVIVSRSSRADADVDFLFAQVTPDSDFVDYESNCGNMLSTVGPFAVEKGLVDAGDGETVVRIYNVNTDAIIVSTIQTPRGQVVYEGDAAIAGVSGTAAPVRENFSGAVGSKTGGLLPTGQVREVIAGHEVTCIDVAVPLVMVRAQDLGKSGHESKAELDEDTSLIEELESIRREAGRRMGMGDVGRFVIPKPVIIAPPRKGGTIAARDFVPYNCHATFSVTGSMALSAACILPGSLANETAGIESMEPQTVSIEHPMGTIDIEVAGHMESGGLAIDEATLVRTCRKLFEGQVYIPQHIWQGEGRRGLCSSATAA